MGNCNCWKQSNGKQICNGTKERETCDCYGYESKCNFYPEKRRKGKIMNTAEMYLRAQKDGMWYKTINSDNEECLKDLFYQKDAGLVYNDGDRCDPGIWNYFDDIMQEQWELRTMTKTEAEKEFKIKIID